MGRVSPGGRHADPRNTGELFGVCSEDKRRAEPVIKARFDKSNVTCITWSQVAAKKVTWQSLSPGKALKQQQIWMQVKLVQ